MRHKKVEGFSLHFTVYCKNTPETWKGTKEFLCILLCIARIHQRHEKARRSFCAFYCVLQEYTRDMKRHEGVSVHFTVYCKNTPETWRGTKEFLCILLCIARVHQRHEKARRSFCAFYSVLQEYTTGTKRHEGVSVYFTVCCKNTPQTWKGTKEFLCILLCVARIHHRHEKARRSFCAFYSLL